MVSGEEPIRIGGQPPFAVPAGRRDPTRRLRGRLVAPVTIWTAGRPPGGAGLTVSSILVAEGQPARVLAGSTDSPSWATHAGDQAFVSSPAAATAHDRAGRRVRPRSGPFERQRGRVDMGAVLGGSRPSELPPGG